MVTTLLAAGVNPNIINIDEVHNLKVLWQCPCLYGLCKLIF